MKWLLAFLICLSTRAATLYSSSPNSWDIQTKVDQASTNGDTIIVPSGRIVWTNNVRIFNKGVSLIATGGVDSVYISLGLPLVVPETTNRNLFYITTLSNQFVRIAGFSITNSGVATPIHGYIQYIGYGWLRVDHNRFLDSPGEAQVWLDGFPQGLGDHNEHRQFTYHAHAYTSMANRWGGPQYDFGDASWYYLPNLGSSNQWVIEDSYFQSTKHFAAMDQFGGSRVIFRYNVVDGDNITGHGKESGIRRRGTYQWDVNNNVFDMRGVPGLISAVEIRGGQGVVWNNRVIGYKQAFDASLYCAYHGWVPCWGGCSGDNPWDDNGPTLFDLQHDGTTTDQTFHHSNAGWITNQWQGFTLMNTNQICGQETLPSPPFTLYAFGEVWSNTSDTIWCGVDKNGGPIDVTLWITNGNYCQLHKVYGSNDRCGNGSGQLLESVYSGMMPRYLHQTMERLWFWGNTWPDGSEAKGVVIDTQQMIDGREIMNGFWKPGYVPLEYPHPLARDSKPMPPTQVQVSRLTNP